MNQFDKLQKCDKIATTKGGKKMNLNDYRIATIIRNSRMKISYRKILKRNAKMLLSGITLATIISLLALPVLTIAGGIKLVLVASALKLGLEIAIPNIKKRNANKKINEVVEVLRKNNIYTSRLKLKQARLATKKPTSHRTAEHESVIAFQNCSGQLQALRQVRVELSQIKNNSNVIPASYVELIDDPNEAKQLYYKIGQLKK